MSNNDFSRWSSYHPRSKDDAEVTTFREKSYNIKFSINDNKNDEKKEYLIHLKINNASNIISVLKGTFPDYSKGIYRVIVSDESGREFSTRRIVGRPAPTWNEVIQIRFSSYPIGQKLKLMVVRENCYIDPGASTGEVVLGRAIILVPGKCFKKNGVVDLVKLVGIEKTVEAVLFFQTSLTTVKIEQNDIR